MNSVPSFGWKSSVGAGGPKWGNDSDEEIRRELHYGWEHSMRTTWLIDFIHICSLNARGESYQRDACHGFLLLIFGTILIPYLSNLIDGALA
ncbi:hypothetical protein CDL15_Pgr012356 [Punica granatum]|uniref:Uncharacterized protein n=1 Tax=Punica granatum TaxID=22663 RepID=A0A218X4R6_PUNGR|nr:hypothetical protein CDL15_Pgr012356 [Punica granatum]